MSLHLPTSLRHLFDDTGGASTIEYSLVIGLIAAALFASASYIDTGITDVLDSAEAGLGVSSGGHPAGSGQGGSGQTDASADGSTGAADGFSTGGDGGLGAASPGADGATDDAGDSVSDDGSGRHAPEP